MMMPMAGISLLRISAAFDAVHLGHIDVHQDDVRAELAADLDGLGAATRCADNFYVTLEHQELAEVFACIGYIVYDQDPIFGIELLAPGLSIILS